MSAQRMCFDRSCPAVCRHRFRNLGQIGDFAACGRSRADSSRRRIVTSMSWCSRAACTTDSTSIWVISGISSLGSSCSEVFSASAGCIFCSSACLSAFLSLEFSALLSASSSTSMLETEGSASFDAKVTISTAESAFAISADIGFLSSTPFVVTAGASAVVSPVLGGVGSRVSFLNWRLLDFLFIFDYFTDRRLHRCSNLLACFFCNSCVFFSICFCGVQGLSSTVVFWRHPG